MVDEIDVNLPWVREFNHLTGRRDGDDPFSLSDSTNNSELNDVDEIDVNLPWVREFNHLTGRRDGDDPFSFSDSTNNSELNDVGSAAGIDVSFPKNRG
ncbi:hypothetical protein SUGI_0241290 [Cryptomeria japonica]|nr:hypothetical protein SUGI_0241290 [Cryptomeria japonica]